MTDRLDAKINLTANTTRDPRGLGLIRMTVTMNRDGYPKFGRVNSEGGITYIVNRGNPYMRPSEATLILSEEEAQIISSSLMSHLYGPHYTANAERMQLLERKLAESERQNREMRKGKKSTEHDLKAALAELKELREIRVRYHDVMAVINAVNLTQTIKPVTPVDS